MLRALLAASVIAVAAAVVVSLAVAVRIARPVSAMAASAERIAGGHYAERVPARTDQGVGGLEEMGEATVGEAHPLEATELVGGEARQLALLERELGVDDLLDLREEPAIHVVKPITLRASSERDTKHCY